MPPTSDNKRVWIISDGNPGHFNQSLAIADVLGDYAVVVTEMIEARLKLRGFLRPLLAVL